MLASWQLATQLAALAAERAVLIAGRAAYEMLDASAMPCAMHGCRVPATLAAMHDAEASQKTHPMHHGDREAAALSMQRAKGRGQRAGGKTPCHGRGLRGREAAANGGGGHSLIATESTFP